MKCITITRSIVVHSIYTIVLLSMILSHRSGPAKCHGVRSGEVIGTHSFSDISYLVGP